MRQIHMFNHFGVKPYVVFDGGYLPSKAATEDDRLRYFREQPTLLPVHMIDLTFSNQTFLNLARFDQPERREQEAGNGAIAVWKV